MSINLNAPVLPIPMPQSREIIPQQNVAACQPHTQTLSGVQNNGGGTSACTFNSSAATNACSFGKSTPLLSTAGKGNCASSATSGNDAATVLSLLMQILSAQKNSGAKSVAF